MESHKFLHALCAFRPRTSARRLRALLSATGSPEAGWNADARTLRTARFSPETIEAFHHHRRVWNLEAEAERLERSDIRLLPETDASYPSLLRQVYDPPPALYVRGALSQTPFTLSVIGSRRASPYGRTATHTLTRPLAARGLTIVSGLAYGIDAEAHRATLAVRGVTIAVLGSGVDESSLYPRAHRDLAREILASGGAVVSEFPPGTGALPEYFPQRNRIIAGMSKAVIIVEATRSSGALITARLALSENREVLVVPGPITSPLSEGTNALLKEGAAPVCSADDVLEVLELQEILRFPPQTNGGTEERSETPGLLPALSAPLARILETVTTEPKALDEIIADTTLPPHEVLGTLSVLELDGRVRDIGGKQYVRV